MAGQIRILLYTLIAVQITDLALHLATGQIEPLRIASNALIGGWALVLLRQKPPCWIGMTAVLAYLALNAIFLMQHGLYNPNQGGELRIPLFVMVGVSALISFFVLRSAGLKRG